MWNRQADGSLHFLPGRDAPELAATEARDCPDYRADDEEEWVNDDPISCYNCRYRRWTRDSFECRKRGN